MKDAAENSTRNALNIPAPVDDCWGFFGTISEHGKIKQTDAAKIWKIACQALADTYSETNPDVIRNFLRSRYGRHLADSVHNHAHRVTNTDKIETIYTEAVAKALTPAKNWRREFRAIREATLSGEWVD